MSKRSVSSRRSSSFLLTALGLALAVTAQGCGTDDDTGLGADNCGAGQTFCSGVCMSSADAAALCSGSGGSSGTTTGSGVDDGAGGSRVATGDGSNPSGGGGSGSSSGGQSNDAGSGGASQTNCTNVAPPYDPNWPDATCEKWANETGECTADWFQGYCDESCGRCTGGSSQSSGGQSGGDNGSSGGNANGNGSGGASTGSGGSMGSGNPWGSVNGGQNGWASRYWDCCKQSCGWSGKGGNSPTRSCDASGENAVGDGTPSACDGGSATTCNSYAPWAYSSDVSFGFVATHAGAGVTCGTCYHLEFTGSSHNGGNDPGSQALSGKSMIVMSTNIGGDVSGDGQMDLLVPGGGTGALYGCNVAWGVQKGDPKLGATYGGLRSGCSGSLDQIKSCVKSKCQDLFGNLPDMLEGCDWYVDWFQAADNPNFRYETIQCPNEISSVAR